MYQRPEVVRSEGQSRVRRQNGGVSLIDQTIEDERLAALRRYDILDTPPDGAFDRITALAARVFDVPIAIVSIVDEDRIWFKSHHGLDSDETERTPGLCASAILHDSPWLVTDARNDPRAMANPLVAGDLGLQFYAGVPLRTADGHALGTLCIIDRVPRVMTAPEVQTLEDLAAVVVDELELRLASKRVSEHERAAADFERRMAQDLADITAAIRELSRSEDPAAARLAICQIALDLTEAESAAIHELAPDDATLIRTTTAGLPWAGEDPALTERSSPATRAYTSGKSVLVDARSPFDSGPAHSVPLPPVSFWQPFAAGSRSPIAVLSLAWHTRTDVSPVRLTRMMNVLATEGLVAIERADLIAHVEGLARTDELTGLPNRRAFNEDLQREMDRARRDGGPLCLAMLDLDRFKRFNDTHGHLAGDRLLADAAEAWRHTLRAGTDLLARFGGEEFVVVLPIPVREATETVGRLRASTPQNQTVSAGLARWDGEETPEALLARADAALYAAKEGGRDRIRWAPHRVAVRGDDGSLRGSYSTAPNRTRESELD